MDDRIKKAASLANSAMYNLKMGNHYVEGAPHIKHASLLRIYSKLAVDAYNTAKKYNNTPQILDLGCGEGSASLIFLELGAKVTAIDISSKQLSELKNKCIKFSENVEIHCAEVFSAIKSLERTNKSYDIVVSNSFLHHIPDYISMVRESAKILKDYGQFFSFQDPLRYDTLTLFSRIFSSFAYISWRIFRGDLVGGLRRRIRRYRGIYIKDCTEDNVEYHVVRNGVDQDAICYLLKDLGFECKLVCYFSTQSTVWQKVGEMLNLVNSFAILANRERSF
jgi:SAM-dependent methyltransferase